MNLKMPFQSAGEKPIWLNVYMERETNEKQKKSETKSDLRISRSSCYYAAATDRLIIKLIMIVMMVKKKKKAMLKPRSFLFCIHDLLFCE